MDRKKLILTQNLDIGEEVKWKYQFQNIPGV